MHKVSRKAGVLGGSTVNKSSSMIESSLQIESQLGIEPSTESPSLGMELLDKVQEATDTLQSSGMDEISVLTIEDSLY